MVLRLPMARPFAPGLLRWRLADSRFEGPGAFDMPSDVVTTDGGGYWLATLAEAPVFTGMEQHALRAMALSLRGGARVDVPFLEKEPTGGLTSVTFSDGSTFSDGTTFQSGTVAAVLELPVTVRDDGMRIRITSGHELIGGDVYSLWRGDQLGSSLHCTASVEQVSPGVWDVEIGPQARQAWAAGTEVNFNDPHCAMRLNDPNGEMWPEFRRGWHGRAAMAFEEAIR